MFTTDAIIRHTIFLLLIGTFYLYTVIYTDSKALLKQFTKTNDLLGARISMGLRRSTLICIPIIGLVTILYGLTLRSTTFSALTWFYIALAILLLLGPFIPSIYTKLLAVKHTQHTSRYALTAIIRIAFAVALGFWFSDNFNSGKVAFYAAQMTTVLIGLDALIELWGIASVKTQKATIITVLLGLGYIASLFFIPIEQLFTFSWSTVQKIPLPLGLYYICSTFIVNMVVLLTGVYNK